MDTVGPPVAAPARLWSLDVLRGLCAGVVFLSHWHLWSNFPPQGLLERFIREFSEQLYRGVTLLTWPTGGQHPAVIGFFVLSGFCIHYPFEYRIIQGGRSVDWRDYARRRFLRIMPVYWAACGLGLGFVLAEHYRPSGNPLLTLHASATLNESVVRFLGLAGVYPYEILAGNYTLTTVSVELLMYALYPVFHPFARRRQWPFIGAVFIGLQLGGVVLFSRLNPFWLFNSVLMLGVFWYAGAFAAHLFLTGRSRVSGTWLLAGWAGYLALKAMPHFYGLNLLKQAAWGVVCVLGILWLLRIEQRHPALGPRPLITFLRRLSDLSYSLYAVHTPVIMLATWTLVQAGIRNYLIQLTVTMAASVGTTLAVYHGLERQFYRSRSVAPNVATRSTAAAKPD